LPGRPAWPIIPAPRRDKETPPVTDAAYPRDLVGYGAEPPQAGWPGDARIAVQFVVNYEEGGERCLLHGDAESEAFLSDIVGAAALPGVRHMNMESLYDYGARAGFWRLMRLFGDRGLPFTGFAVGMALARNPDAARAMAAAGHEVASHGWRWIDYQYVDEATERAHIARAYETIAELTGTPPVGMYQGRTSPATLRLTAEHGGFLYSADSYADDLPYWEKVGDRAMLMVPYTLDANDMRFATAQGFNSGDQFFGYLRDAFDVLYAEGADRPKMMSIGLHCRLIGRPGRAASLARFLDYVQGHDRVWVCRRADIARHWIDRFPAPG
jgi:putative urate catabolism protein